MTLGDGGQQRVAHGFETWAGSDLGSVELVHVEDVGHLRTFGVDLRERDREPELVEHAGEIVDRFAAPLPAGPPEPPATDSSQNPSMGGCIAPTELIWRGA